MKNAFIIVASLLAVSGSAAGEVKVQAPARTGEKTNAPTEQTTVAKATVQTNSMAQGEIGNKINYRRTLLDRAEAEGKPTTSYRFDTDLRPSKPNNVIQSKRFPGIEYSGMLVQLVKNNPLQLMNPCAPAEYGDGEANIVRDPVTKKIEGWKLFQISF